MQFFFPFGLKAAQDKEGGLRYSLKKLTKKEKEKKTFVS